MPCTTILVGKAASYDGSTIIARNDDSGAGSYTPKKYAVVHPEEQPRIYKSVISHVEIELPDDPMRYTCVPNALSGEGIWAASGVNAANVAMTATETITSNPRVLGADPLVCYEPADGDKLEKAGGIGEEDIVSITLPYIKSAREGVIRLGSLLEQYGTYEMNGIAFQDVDEIWWLETIGGHHWIARKVPDDVYVVMPNQFGMDEFDLADAIGAQNEFMCSADLPEFIEKYHLNVENMECVMLRNISQTGELQDKDENDDCGQEVDSTNNETDSSDGTYTSIICPRDIFGSHDDADHVYNTPRAWFMERTLNPNSAVWDGPDADFTPVSDDIPWCMIPEKKITMEDVKYVLSSHYQGTPYDPYGNYGDKSLRGAYRSIGVNRTDFMSAIQIRPYADEDSRAIQWLAFASNAFNVMVPFYTNVDEVPEYLANTSAEVSTDNFYWTSRLIAAMADASYAKSVFHIERYDEKVMSKAHEIIYRYDDLLGASRDVQIDAVSKLGQKLRQQANQEMADMAMHAASDTLGKVLYELSNQMKNSYSRSDA
jgi:dipeptidase